jgi:hypothetical protein
MLFNDASRFKFWQRHAVFALECTVGQFVGSQATPNFVFQDSLQSSIHAAIGLQLPDYLGGPRCNRCTGHSPHHCFLQYGQIVPLPDQTVKELRRKSEPSARQPTIQKPTRATLSAERSKR